MITNIAEIKDRADIVQVIESFIPLRKEAANYKACCPFHEEKTPSFVISPAKQIFTCFGCGKSGDAFKFVEEFRRVDFKEALEIVAQIAGVHLVYENKKDSDRFSRAKVLLSRVNEIFCNALKKEEKIMQYLLNRGLEKEDFTHFDIGYIPNAKEWIGEFNSDDIEILVDLGVINRGNGLYAPLHNRISFALRNAAHKVVGFSARTHPYHDFKNMGKYINSKQSYIFNKSQILYGLTLAKKAILDKNQIIVCEGFMDVIAYHKLGYKNAIATIGTAFNKTHLAQIVKMNAELEIIFGFDNDNAGLIAKERAIKVCISQGISNISVLNLKNEAKDLGEVLEKREKLTLAKVDGFKFLCKHSFIGNAAQKDSKLRELESLLGNLSPFAKSEALKVLKSYAPIYDKEQREETKLSSIEAQILATMGMDEEARVIGREFLSGDDFSPQGKRIFQANVFKSPELANAAILDADNFHSAIVELKRVSLKKQKARAIYTRDYILARRLDEEMHKMMIF